MSFSTIYVPKGGMCSTCIHANRNCANLPFHTMPVIKVHDLVRFVRCTEHKPKTTGAPQ